MEDTAGRHVSRLSDEVLKSINLHERGAVGSEEGATGIWWRAGLDIILS